MAVRTDEFDVKVSNRSLGYNPPQKMGKALWSPFLLMAIMAFGVGFILAIVRSAEVADRVNFDPVTAAQLQHLVPSFMFLGFLSVFAAISFAIARILGEFRKGGGDVQETTGSKVQTLRMPATAKIFMLFMAMGMMVLLGSVILHWIAAGAVDTANLERAAGEWSEWLEAFRRIGVAMYLFGIAFGLGTIITVLRFQSVRIRELPDNGQR